MRMGCKESGKIADITIGVSNSVHYLCFFFLLLRTEFDSQMEETKSVFVMKNSYFSKRLIRYDHENARFMGCSFDARLSMEQ